MRDEMKGGGGGGKTLRPKRSGTNEELSLSLSLSVLLRKKTTEAK